jgi:hypothetical protein
MCRNIKMLFNFEPPVTPDEVRAASLQFVRKISGFNKPSKANEAAFLAAIDGIAGVRRSCWLRWRRMLRRRTGRKRRRRLRLGVRIGFEIVGAGCGVLIFVLGYCAL